jgi:hypothetical protein
MNIDFHAYPEFAVAGISLAAVCALILFLVDIAFAVGVMRDGDRIREKGGEVTFVGPGAWAMGVLVGSFLVVALDWLIHHSSLSKPAGAQSA